MHLISGLILRMHTVPSRVVVGGDVGEVCVDGVFGDSDRIRATSTDDTVMLLVSRSLNYLRFEWFSVGGAGGEMSSPRAQSTLIFSASTVPPIMVGSCVHSSPPAGGGGRFGY